ncbi:O-antigen ligase family protein [Bacillus daqingensis]|uniref:O-antigen ligase family protein n=1 Tax=Bacillus daqingensis TaxID=872396 RepID=A0ABV9NUD9_9BACI
MIDNIVRKKTIKVNILLVLFLGALFIFGHNSNTVIYSNILTLILFLYLIYRWMKQKLTINKYSLLFIPFVMMLILGVLYSPESSYSIVILTSLISCLILFFLIINTFDNKLSPSIYLSSISVSGFLLSLYVLNYYGFNGLFTAIQSGERLGYEISQPNTIGYYLSISSLVTVAIIYDHWNKLSKLLLLIITFALVINIIIIISTYSRSSVLILLIGFLIYLIMQKNFLKAIIFSLLTFSIILLMTIYNNFNLDRFTDTFFLFDDSLVSASDQVRQNLIARGIELFSSNPIIGHGTGAFRYIYSEGILRLVASHNNYIELLVNHGIIGFSLYYFPILVILLANIKIYFKEKSNNTAIILVLVFVDIIVSGISSYTYYRVLSYYILAIAIINIIVYYKEKK